MIPDIKWGQDDENALLWSQRFFSLNVLWRILTRLERLLVEGLESPPRVVLNLYLGIANLLFFGHKISQEQYLQKRNCR